MRYLDLSFSSPAENLALDEALLDFSERGDAGEILRFWESPLPFAVLGYSNEVGKEVRADLCRADGVPILRRCSGGGSVLQGPGCLNYTLILRIPEQGPLRDISKSNAHLMGIHAEKLRPVLGPGLREQGLSDLTLGDLKISGNAQRRRRRFLLFHGTFLLDYDLGLMERFLPMPSRQPDYRRNRSHLDFLTNAGADSSVVKEAMRACWRAEAPLAELPWRKMADLIRDRYGRESWNLGRER